MAWNDRIKAAVYTSPSGLSFSFLYENVSIETEKKTTVFNFPDFEGSFVQDLGRNGRRYPFRIFFTGENYDLLADEFYQALEEIGVGKIEHPLYGTIDVVPTGTIRRIDNLKTAANQAIIEVEFFETTDLTFPVASTDSTTIVNTAIDDFQETASEKFAEDLEINTSSERIDFKAKFLAGVAAINTVLSTVAEAEQAIKSQFDAIVNNIRTNIDDLIGTPAVLAFQTVELLRLPARAAASFTSKIDAYVNLINLSLGTEFFPSFDNKPNNNFLTANLNASSSLIALAESTLVTDFQTKPEAIDAADLIFEDLVNIIIWADRNRNNLNIIDTGETYQAFLEAIVADTSRLVEISFSLKQEKIIYTDRSRTIIDLCAELYGKIDGELDFFINSNNLIGDEILEIPKGREIKYYI